MAGVSESSDVRERHAGVSQDREGEESDENRGRPRERGSYSDAAKTPPVQQRLGGEQKYELPYFRSYTRPLSFALKASVTMLSKRDVEKSIIHNKLETSIVGIQTIRRDKHWIITCDTPEAAEVVRLKLQSDRRFEADELQENKGQSVLLHQVPMEYDNANIMKYLSRYFTGLHIQYHKGPRDLFPTNVHRV